MSTSDDLRDIWEKHCAAELDDREPKRGDSWRRSTARDDVSEIRQRLNRIEHAMMRGFEPELSDLVALVNYGLMLLAKCVDGAECRSDHGIGQRDMPDRGSKHDLD